MQQFPPILPPPVLADGSEAPPRSPAKHGNLVRFQSELEFVQCLANPMYLRELAQQGYLEKTEFINYLKYLEYWREPEYVRYIVSGGTPAVGKASLGTVLILRYPTCLIYLTLLQQSTFRDRLGDPAFVAELARIGARHHETWRVEKAPAAVADAVKVEGQNGHG